MNTNTQPTIWEVPGDVWAIIAPIFNECYPARPKGPLRVNVRPVLHGLIFRLHTGCQWHQLPRPFGDDGSVHRHCRDWCQRGIWARLWAVLVEACEALGGVGGPWQAADAAMGKAWLEGDPVGRNPTDRGKRG